MTINYPNGRTPSNHGGISSKKQDKSTKNFTYSNRGMTFEEMINNTNTYYRERNIALIHKKPTPIQIVKVDYPKRSAAVIKEAYFKEASTTDYNGVYNGIYLDFEAKETKNKTSFPLSNFHSHQLEHMRQCIKHNGIAFVLIWFATLKRCFLLPADQLLIYWDSQSTERKSIPLTEFERSCFEIKIGIAPTVPFIDALSTYMLKEKDDDRTTTTHL